MIKPTLRTGAKIKWWPYKSSMNSSHQHDDHPQKARGTQELALWQAVKEPIENHKRFLLSQTACIWRHHQYGPKLDNLNISFFPCLPRYASSSKHLSNRSTSAAFPPLCQQKAGGPCRLCAKLLCEVVHIHHVMLDVPLDWCTGSIPIDLLVPCCLHLQGSASRTAYFLPVRTNACARHQILPLLQTWTEILEAHGDVQVLASIAQGVSLQGGSLEEPFQGWKLSVYSFQLLTLQSQQGQN